MFSALVSNGALVDRETQDGRTAILYAIARDDAKTLEALVKVAGADVEFDSSLGVTPLSGAATANKPKCVEMLLSLGAKPLKSSRSNSPGFTSLFDGLNRSNEVYHLRDFGTQILSVTVRRHYFAPRRKEKMSQKAIACGATISYEPKSTKRTALAMADDYETSRAFDVLVALGGVATSVCGSGETALDIAANTAIGAPNILVYTATANEPSGNVNYVSTRQRRHMYCCRRGLVDAKALTNFPALT